MTGPKTNERGSFGKGPSTENTGTRAVLRYCRLSPYKVRQVLDLIRGQHVERAREILRFSDRGAAVVVLKLLDSAIANAGNNDDIPEDELFVSACFADEGPTMRRFRPRARGRATRIRKRSCHVTVIVSRLPEEQLARHRQRRLAEETERRARRVAGGSRERRRVRSDAREAAKGTEEVPDQTEDAVNVTPDTGDTPAEDAGVVDQQEQAAAQLAEQPDSTVQVAEDAEESTETVTEEPTDAPEGAAEEAGIVDQQEAAVEAAEEAVEAASDEEEK